MSLFLLPIAKYFHIRNTKSVNKAIISIVLGIVGLMLGPFGLILGAIGLFLGVKALKSPSQDITLPVGYKGSLGGKQASVQPFISSKWLAYISIVLNGIVVLFGIIALAGLGLIGGLFLFGQSLPK